MPVIQSSLGGFGTIQRAGGLGTAQQISVNVQHGNGIGRKALYRGGDQMVDGLHILGC
jgi:hypothetical protein